jgi:hypothetical protein
MMPRDEEVHPSSYLTAKHRKHHRNMIPPNHQTQHHTFPIVKSLDCTPIFLLLKDCFSLADANSPQIQCKSIRLDEIAVT